MKTYTVDEITAIAKEVNEKRNELFKRMDWKERPLLAEGDVGIVLEVIRNSEGE